MNQTAQLRRHVWTRHPEVRRRYYGELQDLRDAERRLVRDNWEVR